MKPVSAFALLGLVAALCAVGTATAQEAAYPGKPIRFIVPYAPGGNTDILARAVGQRVTENWGRPVVVDNRGGANGFLASEIVSKSAPDGYTVFVASTRELCINPHLFAKLPYDPVKDYAPISFGTDSPLLIAVHPSFPAKSVKDVIAIVKSKPVGYATPGVGTPQHLAGEMFNLLAGVKMTHIPYKGGGPAAIALISGQEAVYGYFGVGPAMPHVQSGRMRALAITSEKRSPLLPNLPTSAESGLKDFVISIWFGFMVPANTPKPVAAKLNAEINRVLKLPDVVRNLELTGVEIRPGSAEEFGKLIREDTVKFGKIIKAANIQGN